MPVRPEPVMIEAQPSRTALRVALRRAAHQLHDARPLVLDDPLAVPILGPDARAELARTPDSILRPFSAALRAFMVTRARFAEDVLAEGIRERGVQQYLVLGAGLDTFAYRNPYPALSVFEVDHPATQAWKRDHLAAASIQVSASMRFVAVDFERQNLRDELAAGGFDFNAPTVTAWLGVVPYLTLEAFRATIAMLGSLAQGSDAVLDYSQPRAALSPNEQLMLDSMASRVAQAGEPFQLFFRPQELEEELRRAGLHVIRDLDGPQMSDLYLKGRNDGLALRGKAGRLCQARRT
jgi:methyltransferase (TIGR00027 family)